MTAPTCANWSTWPVQVHTGAPVMPSSATTSVLPPNGRKVSGARRSTITRPRSRLTDCTIPNADGSGTAHLPAPFDNATAVSVAVPERDGDVAAYTRPDADCGSV